MNYVALEKRLRDEIKANYFARFPAPGVRLEIEGLEARTVRLKDVLRKVQLRIKALKVRAEHEAKLAKIRFNFAVAARDIEAGKKLVAIDVERSWAHETQEIGVTVFQNGKFETMNYRVQGMHRKVGFEFGRTIVMSWEDIKEVVHLHCKDAIYYIGHSFVGDLEHMRKKELHLPRAVVMDTYFLSYICEENSFSSLGTLCEHFGIVANRPHCGGNDARYNMELFLAMVEAYGRE